MTLKQEVQAIEAHTAQIRQVTAEIQANSIQELLDAGNLPERSHEPSMGVKQAEAINAELERRAAGGWAK